jgi:hypothetical protein
MKPERDGHEDRDMSKNEDHLFDELIGALEAMSRDAQGLDAKPAPRRPQVASGRSKVLRRTRIGARRALRKARTRTRQGVDAVKQAARIAMAPLAGVRLVVRMIILLVIAGSITLILVTRPFTSGQADARNSPAAVVAQTHTELERVTLRGVEQPAWTLPETSGIEPPRIEVEELPSRSASIDTRYVQTETLRINPVAPETVPQPAQPETVQSEPAQPETRDAPPAAATTTPQHTASTGATAKDPDLEALYQRGRTLQGRLDISSARLIYKRAADRGHAEAALAFAESHDENVTDRNIYGATMDPALARKYYAIARDLGSNRAGDRLQALNSAHP